MKYFNFESAANLDATRLAKYLEDQSNAKINVLLFLKDGKMLVITGTGRVPARFDTPPFAVVDNTLTAKKLELLAAQADDYYRRVRNPESSLSMEISQLLIP